MLSGFYVWKLMRDDGRIVSVAKSRVSQLRKEGRIVEPSSALPIEAKIVIEHYKGIN